ncbi:027a9b7e-ba0c-454a-9b59-b996a237db17 [Sclerotinia trifoliorum]|uniref:027a9b7e-ba0c-454a-9b59-b996a237db17 n=1 Tax=Sclerotinia trifoliorum TaxID=28548 RepID=A0A8H2ZUC7_9HELO|nr:027a9b7e-ba0c-454a-9b59-b996a237db17 [Sclerotinia trifoliorum]
MRCYNCNQWKDLKYLHEFLQSTEFRAFLPYIKPHVAGPAGAELYETDISSRDILASRIIDVFRVNIRDDATKEIAAKTAWEEWMKASGDANFLSGVSVNLPERLFIGMIGWSRVEERERSLANAAHLEEAFEKLNDVRSLVVQFNTAS